MATALRALVLTLALATTALHGADRGQGDGAALAERIATARALPDASARERQVFALLLRVDPERELTPALRAELEHLARYRPQVMAPPDPDHRQAMPRPAWPIDARAKALLRHAQIAQAARDWLARWRASGVPDVDAAPAVIASAVRQATGSERGQLTAAHLAGTPRLPAEALAELAARSTDAGLWADWLRTDASSRAAMALGTVAAHLGEAQAAAVLDAVIRNNPALAPAAVLALGRLDAAGVPRRLIALLDDPGLGASAAYALAQRQRGGWIDALAPAADAAGWRHRVLALRWAGTPQARVRLQGWLADGRIPEPLAGQVRQWLR